MATIRLLLVDDHEVVRSGLRMLLENEADLVIAGEASTGGQALEMVETLEPDVVIMDIALKGKMDGIEAADHIREKFGIPVIYLTAYDDAETRKADALESWADTRLAILGAVDDDPEAKEKLIAALEQRRRPSLRPGPGNLGEGGSGLPSGQLAAGSPPEQTE